MKMINKQTPAKKNPPDGDFKEYLYAKLRNPKEAEAYLSEAYQRSLEDGNGSVFQLALRDVAEAHGGIAWLAKKSGMPRESVYRVLSKDRDPKFASILRVSKPFSLNPYEHRQPIKAR